MYDKLAQLVVRKGRKGANVQKDQPLIIRAHVQDAAFVKKVAKCAYEAGAKYVTVEWHDNDLTKMAYQYESTEVLSQVPQWKYDKTKAQHDDGACYITILSDKPGVMADVDSEKIKAANMAYYTKMADLVGYTMNNEGQWSVIGVPSVDWAKTVFPDLPEEEAFEKLGDAIFAVTRVSEDNDPIAEAQPTSYPRNDGNDYDYSHFRPEEPNPARKAPRQEEESQPSRTKKPRKLSWLESYKSKFDRLLSEPEDEEENDF